MFDALIWFPVSLESVDTDGSIVGYVGMEDLGQEETCRYTHTHTYAYTHTYAHTRTHNYVSHSFFAYNYTAVCNYIELYPVGERLGIPWAALASF